MKREMRDQDSLPPGLYVTATPIGNLADMTYRAVDTLKNADRILCEDTRVASVLMRHYGIQTRLTAHHDHNEERMVERVLGWIRDGEAVALISDAGTPLISDPGYKLVRAVADAGESLITIPGANAAIAGLSISGLATDRFFFEGFLPAKAKGRQDRLQALANIDATLVFYESPRRLAETLAAMTETLGDRPAAIGRELTKAFEEVKRGTLAELAAHYQESGPPKGEVVLMVEAPAEKGTDWQAVEQALAEAMQDKRLKEAVEDVAAMTGAPKRDVYQRALALKDKG